MENLTEEEKNILLDSLSFFQSIEHRTEIISRYGYTSNIFEKVEILEQKIMDL